MKNHLLRLLIRLGLSTSFERKGPPRLLIVSTTGLGDTLWGTPAARALRKKYPDSHIALLTSPIGAALFKNNPHIDYIYTLKSASFLSSLSLLKALRKGRFDTAFIFHLSQRSVLPLVKLAGPSVIRGTLGINKGLDDFLTDPLPEKYQHEIERRLEIAGCAHGDPAMELFVTEEENNQALSHLPPSPLLIGIHPGAKDRFKQWNPKYFIELGRRLAQDKEATLIITGDKSEALLAEEIASSIPGAHSVAGKLSILATAALIEKLDFFITNDTGPMHIAFAMETPTMALFSPTDPHLCGPYKISHGIVFQKPQTCRPCLRKKCVSPFCMEQISPKEVYESITDA